MRLILAAILVSTAAQASLRDKLAEEAKKRLPESAKVRVERVFPTDGVPPSATVRLPASGLPLGLVSWEASWGNSVATGTATIRAEAPVAVTRVPLRHGENVPADAITMESREISRLHQTGFYSSTADLARLVTKGYLPPGTVLTHANTQAPYAVHRGQTVDLIHRRDNLMVSLKVRALEDGRLSQWIRVINPKSQKNLVARVSDDGEVETR